MSHSKHPPFKQLEASRSPFDAKDEFKTSRTVDPDWLPGSGASSAADLPGVKEGLWKGDGGQYKQINPDTVENKGSLYKMLISAVTPRPIAFVSSVGAQGTNLAPFSYFNMCSHNPPIVMVSFTHPSPTKLKDTCANILETKDFTVNMISEPFVDAANYTSIDAPENVSEWPLSGLTPKKSETVKSDWVGEAGFAMECVLDHFYHIKTEDGTRTGTVVLGRVKLFHVREDLIDGESLLVDTAKLLPVSRLGGISYARVRDTYETPRPVFEKEKEREEVKKALQQNADSAK